MSVLSSTMIGIFNHIDRTVAGGLPELWVTVRDNIDGTINLICKRMDKPYFPICTYFWINAPAKDRPTLEAMAFLANLYIGRNVHESKHEKRSFKARRNTAKRFMYQLACTVTRERIRVVNDRPDYWRELHALSEKIRLVSPETMQAAFISSIQYK